MRGLIAALLALAVASCATVTRQTQTTTVLVVPSMHGLHASSPKYGFDTLYALVAGFDPDVVGVEIRPDDIDAPDQYLKKNYPPEMIALRDKYPQRVTGFDWLGPELSGRSIPDGWWKNGSRIKALERQAEKDPSMQSPQADAVAEQEQAILKDATPASLADGRYYRLVMANRALKAKLAGDGPYRELVQFTAERDRRIDRNMISIVRANPGKRIVFVMGADHFGYALDALRATFGPEVHILTPR